MSDPGQSGGQGVWSVPSQGLEAGCSFSTKFHSCVVSEQRAKSKNISKRARVGTIAFLPKNWVMAILSFASYTSVSSGWLLIKMPNYLHQRSDWQGPHLSRGCLYDPLPLVSLKLLHLPPPLRVCILSNLLWQVDVTAHGFCLCACSLPSVFAVYPAVILVFSYCSFFLCLSLLWSVRSLRQVFTFPS